MIRADQINLNTMVWQDGMDGWKPASLIPELAAACAPRLAPGTVVVVPYVQQSAGPVQNRGKSKVTAGILALLIGGLGVHKFYLGGWGWGIMYILFMWTFIPAIVSFIEGIILLTMSTDAFDRAYNYDEVTAFTW
jgi:TM2 domain-containing membrane protein YozV